MKNVLVFPCGSEIGLEINKALKGSKHFRVFGASSVKDHGQYVYSNYIPNLPKHGSSNLISEINNIIEQFDIDYIFPAHDDVVVSFAQNQELLKAIVITSDYETCALCRSKKQSYLKLKNYIQVPEIFSSNLDLSYPIFLKPDIGQGSKGTVKVNSKFELDFYIKKDPNLLILEYLPGKEYTVDCFTDKNGKLLVAQGRSRNRISNGISVNSLAIEDSTYYEIATKINQQIKFRGVWFFQLKENERNELVLLEVSPRIAGTMGLHRSMGINFVQLSLFDRMNIDVEILKSYSNLELDRALISRYKFLNSYKNVYVDFDDTIIINNKVNTELLKFLYQAKNENKVIILLSKHRDDILRSLEKFAISKSLFNEIQILEQKEKKSSYINDDCSIFIDDSFEERKEVFEAKKIPVFDLDAVESLLQWKEF